MERLLLTNLVKFQTFKYLAATRTIRTVSTFKPSVFLNDLQRCHRCKLNSKRISDMASSANSTDLEPLFAHLDTPHFKKLFSPGLKFIQELFKKNNFELRLCGGAVRDLLMDKEPKDIDLATTATPQEMLEMFNKEEIRLIAESGIAHGTVACRVEEENFEITTLRIDVSTDGRHAEVEFTKDWQLDASRRDLTFNSMFLTLDGDLIDYFNGKDDLKHLRVRFVGDAEQRIQEDYLRILRYFRFFARISPSNAEHSPETLATIRRNAHGLSQISGERIWAELSLILKGRIVGEIFSTMRDCGLFKFFSLPESGDTCRFKEICHRCSHLSMNYITPLASLFQTTEELLIFRERIRLSNADFDILFFIVSNMPKITVGPGRLDAYMDILVLWFRQDKRVTFWIYELLKFVGDIQALNYFTNIKVPVMPLKGGEIKQKAGLKGKDISNAFAILFNMWKESRYSLTKTELLNSFDENTDWDDLEKKFPHTDDMPLRLKRKRK